MTSDDSGSERRRSAMAFGRQALTGIGISVLITVVLIGWHEWRGMWTRARDGAYELPEQCEAVLAGIPEYFLVGSGGSDLPVETAASSPDHLTCAWTSDDEKLPGALRIDLRLHGARGMSGAATVAHEAYAARRARLPGTARGSSRAGDESVLMIDGQRDDPKRPRSATILLRRGNALLQVDLRTADREADPVLVRVRTAAVIALQSIAERDDL